MNTYRLRGVAIGTMLAVLGAGGCQSARPLTGQEAAQTAAAERGLSPAHVRAVAHTAGHTVTPEEIAAARAKGESVLVPLGIELSGPPKPRSISGNPLPGKEMAAR